MFHALRLFRLAQQKCDVNISMCTRHEKKVHRYSAVISSVRTSGSIFQFRSNYLISPYLDLTFFDFFQAFGNLKTSALSRKL